MRTLVVGLGIQGKKRLNIAGPDVIATVDNQKPEAQYRSIEEVPLDHYESALVCTSDQAKYSILSYLLSHKKHVLVEKPLLFEDEAQLTELQQLAKKNNLTCYTAYNHRFEPHFVRAREVLAEGTLGKVYALRMFYGNGTAREVRDSAWRDQHMGVLADLGSHLLDTVLFFLDKKDLSFKPVRMLRHENQAFDHILFSSVSNEPFIELEATLLSWRNTFRLDVFCEKGSLHIDCLCKWGPSKLSIRTRVLPSGKPPETSQVLECSDPTWRLEYDHFKKLCKTGQSNIENDIWINRTLRELFREA